MVTFDNVADGLLSVGGPLNQFVIAGADQKFYPAYAVIIDTASKSNVVGDKKTVRDTVLVSSSYVNTPVAVRYAWNSNPEGANLYNTAKLPASPFKTDNWAVDN